MGNETGGERARGWGRALPSLVYSTPSVDSSPGRWVRTAVDRVQGAGAMKEDKVCACTHRCQLASRAPTSGLPCPVGRAGLTVTMRAATAVAAGRTGRIWPRSNCSGGSFGGACRPIFLRGGRFRWGRFAARKTCRVQGWPRWVTQGVTRTEWYGFTSVFSTTRYTFLLFIPAVFIHIIICRIRTLINL
jgi:hypothetical protein